jgi:hypothetical protein
MRILELLGAAAEAEELYLRRNAQRAVRSAILGGVAAVFGLVALGLLHLAAFLWLEDRYGVLAGALLLGGADLVVMLLFLLAAWPRGDRVAEEALALRRQAMAGLTGTSLLGEAVHAFRWGRPALALAGLLGERLVRSILRR